jgi:predicted nucleotidyltransferase
MTGNDSHDPLGHKELIVLEDKLTDPDEQMYMRIQQGLEPDLTFDEFMYFQMEHRIKELEKKRKVAPQKKTDNKGDL